jgi:hypothetical protein
MNILSVDWDFFFPDSTVYDWGHSEHGFFLTKIAWNIRAYNTPITKEGGAFAKDAYVVNKARLRNFWKRICPYPREVGMLVIAESHSDLYHILKASGGGTVWNFDAHHDLGYDDMKELDCGNWAKKAIKHKLIKEYNLVYPSWREDKEERSHYIPDTKYFERIKFDNGETLLTIPWDIVFICRSSAWTPAWSDSSWMRFIGFWKKFEIWDSKLTVLPVLKARRFSEEQSLMFKYGGTNAFANHLPSINAE